jgi:hypothetical protein
LLKRLGNGYHRLIKAFIQYKGHFRGQRLRRLEQFVRLNIQGRGKLDQSLGRNPAVAVFDIAQEIMQNAKIYWKLACFPKYIDNIFGMVYYIK